MEKKVLTGDEYLQKQRERKRDFYAKNRDKLLAKANERYAKKREEIIKSGAEMKPRGRPRINLPLVTVNDSEK